MLEHQDRTVQEVAACICDRCHRRMTPEDLDWHEKLSVTSRGGFDSIFGDGCEVSIDLCQQCVKEALGPWLRITSPVDDLPSPGSIEALKGIVRKPENSVSVESMNPATERLPRKADAASEAARRLANLGGIQPGTEGAPRRHFGALAGKVSMSADFDAPLKIDEATPVTNIVTLGIDSKHAVTARFTAAMKGETQGSFITFASPELLFQTLTQPRWYIVKAMTGVGPQSLREVAHRVGRDVEAVHDDVRALLETGVLERTAEGAVVFPYDAVHVDFMLLAG